MYRVMCSVALVLLFSIILTPFALAEEIYTAKVYRDYPAYIEPPTCVNPRLVPPSFDDTEAVQPASETAASEGSSDPSAMEEKSASSEATLLDGHYYAGIWVGSFSLTSDDIDASAVDIDVDYDLGYASALVVGYDYGSFRFDLEGSYRTAGIDTIDVDNTGAGSVDGDLEMMALIVNGYYDFDVDESMAPYLGIGIGWVNASLDGVKADGVDLIDDDDDVIAGQISAGVLFALDDKTVLDIGYRCLITDDVELDTSFGAVETDPVSHTVMVGLQFSF